MWSRNGPIQFSSVQSLSRVWLFATPCMPGFPVQHQLSDLAQTHIHPVSDAIQPSHPLLSPFLPALNLSKYQGLFQWVGSSHQVAEVLELWCQSFQWLFRVDILQDWLVRSCSLRDSQESPPTSQFRSINSLALSLLYSPTLTFIYDYCNTYGFDHRDVCQKSEVSVFNMLSRFLIAFLPRRVF